MAVYYATKGFVLSFSEALWEEARGTGVHVTCLCPGPTVSNFPSACRHRRDAPGAFGSADAVCSRSRVPATSVLQRNRRVVYHRHPQRRNRACRCVHSACESAQDGPQRAVAGLKPSGPKETATP